MSATMTHGEMMLAHQDYAASYRRAASKPGLSTRLGSDPTFAAKFNGDFAKTWQDGVREERARCGAILTRGLELGQYDQALVLALSTDLNAQAACAMLDTLPAGGAAAVTRVTVPATDFSEHMARVAACGRVAGQTEPGEVEAMLQRAREREGRS